MRLDSKQKTLRLDTMREDLNKSLGSDNHSGIHPKVLQAIFEANKGHAPSYGTDHITSRVQELFREVFGNEAHFVFNGTAANVLCLKSLLQSHEAVICAVTSHLNQNECGAPEFITGCKLIPLKSSDGKITPQQIDIHLTHKGDQHYSQVKMISITQPTEYGTVYSLEEMRALRKKCDEHSLFLHIDGARLIYAAHYLKCELKEIAAYADAISFGVPKMDSF